MNSKKIIGVTMMIVAIPLALWLGGWWAFIGGICQIVDAFRTSDAHMGMSIGIGALKIVCAGFIGGLTFVLLLMPGYALYSAATARSRRY